MSGEAKHHASIPHGSGPLLAGAAMLVACSQLPREQANPIGATARASASASASASATITASPKVEHRVYDDLSPRTGAPGSTFKTISCGAVRCEAGKAACHWNHEAKQWGCGPVAEYKVPNDFTEDNWLVASCDDSSDCPPPTRCRRAGHFRQTCIAPDDIYSAWEEVCTDDGSSCPDGTKCHKFVEEMIDPTGLQGGCRGPVLVPMCNGERCTQDKPFCVWSDTHAECAEGHSRLYEETDWTHKFYCGSNEDCPTNLLCLKAHGESHGQTATRCQVPGEYDALAMPCELKGEKDRPLTVKESAKICRIAGGAICNEKLRCVADSAPAWLGTVRWPE